MTDIAEHQLALDKQVRSYVYDFVMRSGRPPTLAETAHALSETPEQIDAAFQRLADAHMLVLQRANGEILMANPFSAVPTPFIVQSGGQSYYGSCIWDAMGIPAMLGQDAVLETSCGCCGTAMKLEFKGESLTAAPGIVHFAIPAAHWWDDIVFN